MSFLIVLMLISVGPKSKSVALREYGVVSCSAGAWGEMLVVVSLPEFVSGVWFISWVLKGALLGLDDLGFVEDFGHCNAKLKRSPSENPSHCCQNPFQLIG